jgi:hypothetical protein
MREASLFGDVDNRHPPAHVVLDEEAAGQKLLRSCVPVDVPDCPDDAWGCRRRASSAVLHRRTGLAERRLPPRSVHHLRTVRPVSPGRSERI